MSALDLPHAVWRKSSRSGNGQDCVEVAEMRGGVRAVRDSKNPNGPTLTFPSDEWHAFVAGVKRNAHLI
ncbi:DUF397 domain-containing protein [Sphaerisporangium sp. NPDC051011]|uniref:DUF397 domain-containing protein n=1 Tax=Sphaerisporangium sp. NPDC051011 TaxID=3155792 RepID=UPI0033E3A3E6